MDVSYLISNLEADFNEIWGKCRLLAKQQLVVFFGADWLMILDVHFLYFLVTSCTYRNRQSVVHVTRGCQGEFGADLDPDAGLLWKK